jgi:hypothetical protein
MTGAFMKAGKFLVHDVDFDFTRVVVLYEGLPVATVPAEEIEAYLVQTQGSIPGDWSVGAHKPFVRERIGQLGPIIASKWQAGEREIVLRVEDLVAALHLTAQR